MNKNKQSIIQDSQFLWCKAKLNIIKYIKKTIKYTNWEDLFNKAFTLMFYCFFIMLGIGISKSIYELIELLIICG